MTLDAGKHLSFPFRIAKDGRTAQVSTNEEHLRDEIMQLMLSNPGERVDLPEFGGGVRMLVFEGADKTAENMTKARITQALSRWLGHRVTLEDIQVAVDNAKIEVSLKYRLAGTKDSRVLKFQRMNG